LRSRSPASVGETPSLARDVIEPFSQEKFVRVNGVPGVEIMREPNYPDGSATSGNVGQYEQLDGIAYEIGRKNTHSYA
jgi:hypothetical protein